MNRPKISVIVPIYNVEKYLRQCLDSIVNQTYKNLEIILVDDGSPDNSGEICDEYCKKDERVQVIHKKNGGLADARNTGLMVATGTYIAFVDSDDYLEPDMYEKLYSAIIDNNADISICNCFWGDQVGYKESDVTESRDSLNALSFAYRNMFGEDMKFAIMVMWNKLYKRELFDNVRLQSQYLVGEDVAILANIFSQADKCIFVHKNMYHYRLNSESITHERFTSKRMWSIYSYDVFLNCISGKISQEDYEHWSELFVEMSVRIMKMVSDSKLSTREKNKYIKEIIKYLKIHKKNSLKEFSTKGNFVRYNLVCLLKLNYFKLADLFKIRYGLWVSTEKTM